MKALWPSDFSTVKGRNWNKLSLSCILALKFWTYLLFIDAPFFFPIWNERNWKLNLSWEIQTRKLSLWRYDGKHLPTQVPFLDVNICKDHCLKHSLISCIYDYHFLKILFIIAHVLAGWLGFGWSRLALVDISALDHWCVDGCVTVMLLHVPSPFHAIDVLLVGEAQG